jgi:hypothetical protein
VRRFLFLACLAALCCRRPAVQDGFTLRVGVAGPILPLTHDTKSGAASLAQDLVFDDAFRPSGSGFASRLFSRWERRGATGLRAEVAEGITFSDGSPLMPQDVAASADAAGLAARVDGRWLDLEPRDAGFPVEIVLLTATVFKSTPRGDVGTGPFRVVAQDAQRMALERVVPRPGRIARVELVSFSSVREAFARALKGEVNAVLNLDDRHVELAEGVPHLQVVRSRGPHALAILMNAQRLRAPDRQAIAAALPLGEIEEVAQGKGCGPTSGRHVPMPLARGRPLDLGVSVVDPSLERAALAVRRSLGARGGEVARLDPAALEQGLREHDLTLDALLVWPPAFGALYWKTASPLNWTGYSNRAYDAALEAGDFARAERELERDPPALLLCRRERIAVVDARLRNVTLGTWGPVETLADWEVAP